MAGKRIWYIAVSDVSGEHAGDPACFNASEIFGPYTLEQAEQALALSDQFPDETYTITIFCADDRPLFRSLMKRLREQLKEAIREDSEAHDACRRRFEGED